MQVLNQGTHPTLGPFLHALLPQVEEGVTQFLTAIGGKATIHKITSAGEVLSTDLNLPILRDILQVVDGLAQ